MKNIYIFSLALWSMACATPTASNAQTWTLEQGTVLTQTDLVTGLFRPWEILWGPDDYIWCTLRNGKVLHVDPLTGNYTTVLNISSVIPNSGNGEPGMLGMCLHPDFTNNPKVYIVYNYSSGGTKERLVSYEWDGTNLINETTLIDAIPGAGIHNGSRLIISPDNKILMTTGDKGSGGTLSQDMASLNGKVLRINLDGSIPTDNPDPASYVYTFGLRNSQGLCVGANGIIYSSEHGQSNSDEFNIIEPNRNYGWPSVEGACNTTSEQTYCAANNVKEPLKEWSPCVAVNGVEYYNHPAIPEWSNSVIMGVMGGLSGTGSSNDRVSVLHLSTDGLAVELETKYFTTLNQRFRDICVNPYTGAVYVATNGTDYPGDGLNKILEFRNMAFVGVDQLSATVGQDISAYPNPAADYITFQISSSLIGSTLELYSFNGTLVKEVKITSEKQVVDISNLGMGNYWALATNNLGTTTCEFQKQ
jgi:aldose sugar dehydrogenase